MHRFCKSEAPVASRRADFEMGEVVQLPAGLPVLRNEREASWLPACLCFLIVGPLVAATAARSSALGYSRAVVSDM